MITKKIGSITVEIIKRDKDRAGGDDYYLRIKNSRDYKENWVYIEGSEYWEIGRIFDAAKEILS